MDCKSAKDRMFGFMDGELSGEEQAQLQQHLSDCSICSWEMKLSLFPRKIGQVIRRLEPSPLFYRSLRDRLQAEAAVPAIWTVILGLSRRMVPALGTLTLAIVSIFAYLQFTGAGTDIDFAAEDPVREIVISEQHEITDETVLLAIAGVESAPVR